MSEWKALVGRISLFTGPVQPSSTLTGLELFRLVWKRDPDNFFSSKNPLAPTTAQARGFGLTTGCSVQPTRIDLNLTPLPPETESSELTVTVIEDTQVLHAEMTRLIRFVGTFADPYSINRVGTYLHFIRLTSSIREGNSILTQTIPELYRPRLTAEEEFILQVSRPRSSSVDQQIKLNLITKWSVDRFRVLNLSVQLDGVARQIPTPSEVIGASIVSDNNNVPLDSSLNSAQQVALLSECFQETVKVQRELNLGVYGF